MLNKFKDLFGFRGISEFFLCFFVIFVVFPVKFLVFSSALYESGEFSPFFSHFLYLSDVCFVLALFFFGLFLVFRKHEVLESKSACFDKNLLFLTAAFLFFVIFSLFFSINIENSLVYVLRMIEFFVIYLLFIFEFVSWKKIAYVFLWALFVSSLIGILQFVLQHSVGFNFFGESQISNDLVGVAKLDVFNLKLLRIYGTFSHPNIFAAYLLIGIILLFYYLKNSLIVSRKIAILALTVFFVALFLTFSKTIFIALFSILFFLFKDKFVKERRLILLMIVITLFTLFLLSETSIMERLRFIFVSLNLFVHNPFGVGIGNFTEAMPLFSFYKLFPWNFQPVHNTFLLILNEIGLQGLIVFLLILIYLFHEALKAKNIFNFSLALSLFWMALFDHHLFSLYQGQFLFWFVLARFGYKSF